MCRKLCRSECSRLDRLAELIQNLCDFRCRYWRNSLIFVERTWKSTRICISVFWGIGCFHAHQLPRKQPLDTQARSQPAWLHPCLQRCGDSRLLHLGDGRRGIIEKNLEHRRALICAKKENIEWIYIFCLVSPYCSKLFLKRSFENLLLHVFLRFLLNFGQYLFAAL